MDVADVVEVQGQTQKAAEKASEPRVRTAIAVVMTYFPRIEETYILREINELERHGQPVVVVPIVRESPAIVHEQAKPWVQRALFTPFISAAIFTSNVRSFFSDPGRYLRLLGTLIAGTIWRPSTLVRTLSIVPKAVHLARVLGEKGVKHVHSHFATHATTLAYAIASVSDITFSFTVHGPDVFVHRLLLRRKLEKARFVRCISTFNKAFLSGLYPHETEGKLEVVRTGVNPDVYEEAALRSSRITRVRPQLLSISPLTARTGFGFLIDACARLIKDGVDLDCTIVGDGPLRRTAEHWIAQHGLTDRVRILGNLPQHEVARLMGETDIFVLPSIIATDGQMDGIPVSLMEAMAAGKPVVASALSGIPELVRHNISGLLVDAAYPQRIADAVRRLIEDPALRERLGNAAQQVVRERFDVRRTSQSLIRLLDRTDDVNRPARSTAERILNLNWNRMNATALGVRRVHERNDSYLAEVTINDGVTTRDVIVRQHCDTEESDPRDRARTEFEVLTTLRQSLRDRDFGELTATSAACSVPRLVMFDEPNAAIVFERADGTSLAGIMNDGVKTTNGRLGPALRKAGTWLRVMQERTAGSEDGRHVLTAVVLLALRDADLVAAGDRALRRRRDAIVERLQQLEAVIANAPLSVTGHHGNYGPENIFIGSRSIDVVDFGGYREGLPIEDVAEMLIHLELRAGTRNDAYEAMRRAFFDGYGDPAAIDEPSLQLFTLTRALQMLARDGVAAQHARKLRKIIARCVA